MSPRVGMSMDSGTVAGNRKVFRRNQTALNGGKNSNGIKELLKGSLEIKMNNFSVKQAVYKNLRNFRLYFLSFLPFSFWFCRSFSIPRRRKKFFAAVEIRFRSFPKPVHEIIVRAKRR